MIWQLSTILSKTSLFFFFLSYLLPLTCLLLPLVQDLFSNSYILLMFTALSGPSTPLPRPEPFAYSLSSNKLLNSLNATIATSQQSVNLLTCYIQKSLSQQQQLRCECKSILGGSLSKLKQTFNLLAQQWKSELPSILNEFWGIVKKICELYEQENCRLAEKNKKWQFSYNQLLKAVRTSSQEPPNKDTLKIKKKRTPAKMKTLDQSCLMRADLSLMREQITELFQEDEQSEGGRHSAEVGEAGEVGEVGEQPKEGKMQNMTYKKNSEFLVRDSQTFSRSEMISRKNSASRDNFWQNLKENMSLKQTFGLSISKESEINKENNLSMKSHKPGEESGSKIKNEKLKELRRNLLKQRSSVCGRR